MVSNDRHYAVVVGIDKYPKIDPLNGPVNDAKNFRDWLVDAAGGGLDPDNVRLVISDPAVADARPVQDEIDDALLEINDRARQAIGDSNEAFLRSRLILYVAGHGIMPSDGDGALLLANARSGAYSRNIELRAYADWYKKAGLFAQVIIYADCCRNFWAAARGTPPTMDDPARPNGDVAYLIWYATGVGRYSYEDTDPSIPPDQRRGYFTTALLDGLRGGAVAGADGAITARALLGYVSDRVAKAVTASNKRYPQKVSPVGTLEDVVLASTTVPRHAHVTIRFPDGFTGAVELEQPDGSREPYDPAAGPWQLDLPPGRYGVVLAGTEDGSAFAGEGLFRVTGDDRDVTL